MAYRQIIKLLYVSSYINSAHTLRQNSQLIFPGLQFLPVPKTCKCIFHIQFCESRGKGDLCMFYCILYISAFSPTLGPLLISILRSFCMIEHRFIPLILTVHQQILNTSWRMAPLCMTEQCWHQRAVNKHHVQMTDFCCSLSQRMH